MVATRARPVVDRDRGWNAIKKRVGEVGDLVLQIGVRDSSRAGDGISNAELASIHEFGTEHVPERSFIRSTMDEHREEYARILAAEARKVIEGKRTPALSMDLMGQKVASDMQRKIEQGVPPPNADSTIKRKGSSKPLVDSGQLKNAITYRVVNGRVAGAEDKRAARAARNLRAVASGGGRLLGGGA